MSESHVFAVPVALAEADLQLLLRDLQRIERFQAQVLQAPFDPQRVIKAVKGLRRLLREGRINSTPRRLTLIDLLAETANADPLCLCRRTPTDWMRPSERFCFFLDPGQTPETCEELRLVDCWIEAWLRRQPLREAEEASDGPLWRRRE